MPSISQLLSIRQHEIKDVIYFLLLFFLIGGGMALGRGTAEALFFKRYGIEFLPLMYIALGGLLVVITSVYASVADTFPAEKLLKRICLVLSLVLIVCWGIMAFSDWDGIYPVYFLIYEIASEVLLVHCALYVSQNFDTLQSKRLIPVILGGAQIGTIIGGLSLAGFSLIMSVDSLLLVWIVVLAISLFVINRHHQLRGCSPYYRNSRKGQNSIRQVQEQFRQCFSFARHSKFMMAMSLCLFFTVIAFYVLAFSINQIYTDYFSTEAELSSFFGLLVAANGILALLLQLFFTNKIIERIGLRFANLIFPSVTLFSFIFLFAAFSLPAAIIGSFVKDALMPAIRNPIRNMFFNAIPANFRGRAHAFSIGLVLPLAMMITGGLLIVLQQWGDITQIVFFGLLMAVPLFWYSYRMNQAYGPAILTELRKKVFVPDEGLKFAIQGEKVHILSALNQSASSENMEVRYAAAETLLELYAEKESDRILEIAETLPAAKQDILLQQLLPLLSEKRRTEVFVDFRKVEQHLHATLLFCLITAKDSAAKDYAALALYDKNPRIIAAGIFGVLSLSIEKYEEDAWIKWNELLHSDHIDRILSGLNIFQRYPSSELLDDISVYLHSANFRIQQAAVNTLPNWPDDRTNDLFDTIKQLALHESPVIRIKVLSITRLLPKAKQNKIAVLCLQDNHLLVRHEAASILFGNEEDLRIISNWICHSSFPPNAKQSVMKLLFGLEPQVKILQEMAYTNIADAEEFYKAYQDIRQSITAGYSKNAKIEVLSILLLERCWQTLDNVLNTVREYENKESVGIIYSGIKSKDTLHIANACEALGTLHDVRLANMITGLIEKLGDTQYSMATVRNTHLNREVLEQALGWCMKRNDNWLMYCAREVSLFAKGNPC